MSKEEKSIATKTEGSMSVPGTMMPADFNNLIGDGFASVETVVFGDHTLNKLPLYVGQLEGPTDSVEVGEEIFDRRTGEVKRNKMPCWVFKPMTKTPDGTVGTVENVTHIVPCNYQVDAACKRIWAEVERRGNVKAIVAVLFQGKEGIKNNTRQLNRYRVFEKYIPKQAT